MLSFTPGRCLPGGLRCSRSTTPTTPAGNVRMTPASGARAEKTLRSVLRFHPIVTAHAHDNTENVHSAAQLTDIAICGAHIGEPTGDTCWRWKQEEYQ